MEDEQAQLGGGGVGKVSLSYHVYERIRESCIRSMNQHELPFFQFVIIANCEMKMRQSPKKVFLVQLFRMQWSETIISVGPSLPA